MEYVLPLQGDDTPQRHTTTLHMMLAFLLASICFACIALNYYASVLLFLRKLPYLGFGLCCGAMSVALVYLTVKAKAWMRKKEANLALRITELAMMIVAAVFFFIAGWKIPSTLFSVMGAVLVYALVAERRGDPAPVAIFKVDAIMLQGAKAKTIKWSRVAQVILKHNILTISLRNNSIIQRSIAAPGAAPPAAIFENWCKEQINIHHDKAAEVW